MPATMVIPAPLVYIKVVSVKKLIKLKNIKIPLKIMKLKKLKSS